MSRAIIQSLPSGGTEWGQSFWRQLVYGCPRRALIAKARRLARGVEAGYLKIGTIYHAFQDLYHSRKKPWECRAVKFTSVSAGGTSDEIARIEAERLFKEYRLQYKPNAMGRVIATEQLLPANEVQRKAINKATGFPEYTCRIDMVLQIPLGKVKYIRATRGIRVKAGRWIKDWKTAASMSALDYEKFQIELQAAMYQIAYAAAFPKVKLQGLIFDVVTKTKQIEFPAVAVPKIGPRERRIVASFAEQANAAWDAWGENDPMAAPCNPDRCFDWYRSCPYLYKPCQRY